jgi:predicted alpha/beta-hydrolase family hydrolase
VTASAEPAVREVETPHGPARVHLHAAASPRAGLVMGHGAGGGIGSRDLELTTRVGLELGVSVALVEQPYRVAGRRGPSPARQLDAAWTAVIADLRGGELAGLPILVGGRSSGARVACRTAAATEAAAVLCLAFPLIPPGRGDRPSRLPELDGVEVPALVVQGRNDAFGLPPEGPSRRVVLVAGDHALRSDAAGLTAAVRDWLEEVLGPPGR